MHFLCNPFSFVKVLLLISLSGFFLRKKYRFTNKKIINFVFLNSTILKIFFKKKNKKFIKGIAKMAMPDSQR